MMKEVKKVSLDTEVRRIITRVSTTGHVTRVADWNDGYYFILITIHINTATVVTIVAFLFFL